MTTGLRKLPWDKKLAAMGSFLLLGMSPDYIDWQDHPEKRKQIILYYGATLALLYYGLLD